MRRRTVLAVALVAAVSGGVALASPGAPSPSVLIRIEGAKKTLVPRTLVRARSGWITKYGAPKGKCPAQSVQGALDRATDGQWKGTWSAQFKEYFITSILGEKPAGHNFWEIFVNNRAATKGACDLKLQKDEQILFADTNGKHYPSEMGVFKSKRSASGVTYSVELIGFNAHGKSKPLAGVQIVGRGVQTATTDAKGQAMITDDHAGPLLLRSAPKGYIRSEVEVFGPSA